MNAATFGRDPFMPSPPTGRGPALALALIAHALLIAALAFGVHWRNSEPTTMAAELWTAVPQAAAPRAAEPAPTAVPTPPPQPRKPEPAARRAEPVPAPQAATRPDPQIAIEQARREAARRDKAERDEGERERQQAREDQARKAAKTDKLKADALKVERDKIEREKAEREKADRAEKSAKAAKAAALTEKAEAAQQDAIRSANLKRLQGLATANSAANSAATDTGAAARSSGPSASYAGRIMARIKPNIVFGDTPDGNPMATVEVKLAPDGTIVAKRLVKSSGVKAWDEAVLRAIERTEILPRDIDGRVPPPFQIDFRLRD